MDEINYQNRVGRPTKYKEEYCQKLIDHMSKGYSFESFAGEIEVSREVLYDWCDKHEQFLHSKNIAFDKCQLFWEKMGMSGMWSDKQQSFNASMWIFSMKARFKWSDRVEIEQDSKSTITLAYKKDG